MNTKKYKESQYHGKVKGLVRLAEGLRAESQDVSFAEAVKDKYDVSLGEFLEELGIDTTTDTISNIFSLPDDDVRWVVPEIIRDAIRVGLRDAPIWNAVTAAEQETSQLKIKMPYINMSDAAPRKVGEGETIPFGTISYGDKEVSVYKIGRGIRLTYEVMNYVSLDVVSIFFQDFGVKLGHALDTLAIDVLTNGDQGDGSDSAPVLGVTTAATKVYKDFLRIWIRGSRMGRSFNTIIGGEAAALETLDLSEFKDRKSGTTDATLNMQTPVPNSASYFIHGNIPDDQELMVDKRFALLKFNVVPLMIESEKVVSNQTEAFYATLTTGFGKMFRDAAVIMDKSLAFASNGFPTYMDVDQYQNVVIE